MGLFDKFKKKSEKSMHYDDKLKRYVIEINGIIFVCEEEQDEDYINNLSVIADNYYDNLNSIVDFIMPDINEMYHQSDIDMIKENLGKPIIDYDNGTVEYLEQTFDDIHIFSFEFLDDDFKDIQYFSIDG